MFKFFNLKRSKFNPSSELYACLGHVQDGGVPGWWNGPGASYCSCR
jgi:hypothetical protein